MNHGELIQLKEEIGETPGFCFLCQRWLGESKLRPFMGKDVCFGCYQRFKNYLENLDPLDAMEWFFKRISADFNIRKVQKFSYRVSLKIRQTES